MQASLTREVLALIRFQKETYSKGVARPVAIKQVLTRARRITVPWILRVIDE